MTPGDSTTSLPHLPLQLRWLVNSSSMFWFWSFCTICAHMLSDFALIRDVFWLIPYICVTSGTDLAKCHICPNFWVCPKIALMHFMWCIWALICSEVVVRHNAHMLSDFALICDVFSWFLTFVFVWSTAVAEYQICPNFLVGCNYDGSLKLHWCIFCDIFEP